MDTEKGRINIKSDIRLSVALLSLCGFLVFFLIASFLVLKLMELNPNNDPANLASIKTSFSYFQVGCLVLGVLSVIIGIKRILNLRQFDMPKIKSSKFFSRFFAIIGILIGFMLIIFLLPSSSANINIESIEMYMTVRFYAKIFVAYTFALYLVTLFLRKRGSVYSIGATTSFSLILPISLFPFGFIFLFVWLFSRGSEISNFNDMITKEQNK